MTCGSHGAAAAQRKGAVCHLGLPQLAPESPNTNGTLMAFNMATFPTSSLFLPSEPPRRQAPSEAKAPS